MNKDKTVTIDELEELIELKYKVERSVTRQFFKKVDVDNSGDLAPGELVDFRYFHLQKLSYHFFQHDFFSLSLFCPRFLLRGFLFRHEIRRYVTERNMHRSYDSSKSNDHDGTHVGSTEEVRKQQFTSFPSSSNKNYKQQLQQQREQQ